MPKVLVLGSGGRESAVSWKLQQNPEIEVVRERGLEKKSFESIVAYAKEKAIEFCVIGPEEPLVNGLVDVLEQHKIPTFGPGKAAAKIEGSKVFAKEFMRKHKIPTARFSYALHYGQVKTMAECRLKKEGGAVIKMDGLAAGKGVFVCRSEEEIRDVLHKIFSQASLRSPEWCAGYTLVEDLLEGEEVSYMVFTDGHAFKPLTPAQDYKRVGDHDTGLNTGGMGAYAPTPFLTRDLELHIQQEIIVPTLEGLAAEGCPYKGVLYAGLMLTPEGPKVLEFNCRLGDPETQVQLPLLESDMYTIMEACVEGNLERVEVTLGSQSAVGVVLASQGYPESYDTGKVIDGLDEVGDVLVFLAGAHQEGDAMLTEGGRVLTVTGLGRNIKEAQEKAYKAAEIIQFEGKHYRTDIGRKALC